MPGCIHVLAARPWLVASGSSLRAVTGPRTWGSADTESCSPNIAPDTGSQSYIMVHIQEKHLYTCEDVKKSLHKITICNTYLSM